MDPASYEKVVFTRDGDAELRPARTRGLRWVSALEDPSALHAALSAVVMESLDGHDARLNTSQGVQAVVQSYLDVDEGHFVRDPSRWETAFDGGELVGFIQPVLYVNGAQGLRPEGTINYIGVVPQRRGCGYIDDLLRRATASLYAQDVWRIFCDTDVRNFPMIAAFERMGYVRGAVRSVPIDR